jgi:hypothetical protein
MDEPMSSKRTRTHRLVIVAGMAAALTLALLGGCSGAGTSAIPGAGPKYTAADLTKVWQASPESANWDLEVREVITEKKSTGSHDADYTVFLTTYTNKKVPAFKMYQTVDIPPDDSMTFDQRASAFFSAIASGSQFSGVQDPETFMTWYAKEYPDKYFVRLVQNTDSDGKNTWELIAYDAPPTKSTMTGEAGKTGVFFAYDVATKTWAEVTP